MPYNNQPITPSQDVTGTINLPLTRVKKIIHADPDLANCSNNAAFAIAVATEQFLQYLVEQTHQVARADKKPRRNLQYKDVANAVARHDNLEFLTDVVPKTMTYKEYKEKAERAKGQVKAVDDLTKGLAKEASAEAKPEEEKPDHAGPEVMDIDVVVAPEHSHASIMNGAPATNGDRHD